MGRNLIYLLFVPIIFGLTSCDSQGHVGISNDINESKNRNVFISEYEVNPNPYIINDTLKIKVSKAWVEKQWGYGRYNDETIIIEDKFQLVIEVSPNTLQTYGLTWRIGINGDRYIRSCGSNCLMSSFDQLPKDIEEWKVQDSWELDSLSKKTIIGNFRIHKKIN